MMEGVGVGHGAEVKDRRIAIGLSYPLQFVGDRFQGLFPGYPGKFAGALGAGSLQGIEQPVRGVYPLAIGPAPKTHPVRIFPFIATFYSGDLAVLDVHLHFAGAAAMAGTDSVNDLFSIGLAHMHILSVSSAQKSLFGPMV